MVSVIAMLYKSLAKKIENESSDVCVHLEMFNKNIQRQLDNHEHRIQKLEDIQS